MTIQEIHDSIRTLESGRQILLTAKNTHDGNTKDNELHEKRIADYETAITALENYKEQSYIALQMDTITTEMMEHVCDKICRYPYEISDQEELEEKCSACKMDRYVCNICNLGKENKNESKKCEKK